MRLGVIAGLISVILTCAPFVPAAPARADGTVSLVGHGWGHGRGLGQWGALGYAVDYGWSWLQILEHYYGGTTYGTASASAIIDVLLRDHYGGDTIVYVDSGSLVTNTDTALGATDQRALLVRWKGDNRYEVYDGPGCSGAWRLRGTVDQAEVLIAASAPTDDRSTMLQLCEGTARRYVRGEVVATAFKTNLDAIKQQTVNRTQIDWYLRSVVAAEMPSSWGAVGSGKGQQALYAQAVAARSYALAGDNRWGPADTCNDIFCQVYKGVGLVTSTGYTSFEATSTTKAVVDTPGVVRMSGLNIARTEFSSSTGGYTAGGAFPAVVDLGDAYASNPRHNWKAVISTSSIEAAFDGVAGRDLGTFQRLVVTERNGLGDLGGRVRTVQGEFSGGSATMTGNRFRSEFGLLSDWFALAGPEWLPVVQLRDASVIASPGVAGFRGPYGPLDTFAIGRDGAVWWTRGTGPDSTAWLWLGAPPTGVKGDPAGVSWGLRRLDVFVRGGDDQLWQRTSVDDGATWGNWIKPIGDTSRLASSPDVVSRHDGALDVVAFGTDGQVYQRWYVASVGWGPHWIGLGAPPPGTGPSGGRPTIASWDPYRADVFVRGADDRLWHRAWVDRVGWSGWMQPAGTEQGTLASSPEAVSWGTGHLSVFIRGTDGGLYVSTWIGPPAWLGWRRLGNANDTMVGTPAATSRGSGSLDIIVRGPDDRIYRYGYRS